MDEIHAAGINGDVGRTERSDGGGRSIESDEMHRHIAVVTEGGRDREAGSERATERVDKDVDALALVFGKNGVHVATVEVIASDVAFKRNVICGFRHGKTNFATKLPLYIRREKDTKKAHSRETASLII